MERTRPRALGILLIGTALAFATYAFPPAIILAWIVTAIGLLLLSRVPSWRRAAYVALACEIAGIVAALGEIGLSIGLRGRGIGSVDPFGGALSTFGILGAVAAPFAASLAVALGPTAGGARVVARIGSGIGAFGVLVGAVSLYDEGFFGLMGVPMLLLPARALVAVAWAWWRAPPSERAANAPAA